MSDLAEARAKLAKAAIEFIAAHRVLGEMDHGDLIDAAGEYFSAMHPSNQARAMRKARQDYGIPGPASPDRERGA